MKQVLKNLIFNKNWRERGESCWRPPNAHDLKQRIRFGWILSGLLNSHLPPACRDSGLQAEQQAENWQNLIGRFKISDASEEKKKKGFCFWLGDLTVSVTNKQTNKR